MHVCMYVVVVVHDVPSSSHVDSPFGPLFLTLTTGGFSFLLMLRLSSIAYTCLADMVSKGGASAWLGVLPLTWRRYA